MEQQNVLVLRNNQEILENHSEINSIASTFQGENVRIRLLHNFNDDSRVSVIDNDKGLLEVLRFDSSCNVHALGKTLGYDVNVGRCNMSGDWKFWSFTPIGGSPIYFEKIARNLPDYTNLEYVELYATEHYFQRHFDHVRVHQA